MDCFLFVMKGLSKHVITLAPFSSPTQNEFCSSHFCIVFFLCDTAYDNHIVRPTH